MIATGTGLRLFDPLENREEYILTRKTGPRKPLTTPRWLAGSSIRRGQRSQRTWSCFKLLWPFGRPGASWVRDQGPWARAFKVWKSNDPPARAWLVRMNELAAPEVLDEWSGKPRDILRVLETAEPLLAESSRPENWTIQVDADDQAWVIVSQLADPQWKARWISLETPFERDETILPTFQKSGENGGWQRIEVPGSGSWLLRLEYDAQDVTFGVAISAVAWLSWLLAAFHTGFRAKMAVRSAGAAKRREHKVTNMIGVAIVGASGYTAPGVDPDLARASGGADHGRDIAARRGAAPGGAAPQPRPAHRPQVRGLQPRPHCGDGVVRLFGTAAHGKHGRGARSGRECG